MTTCPGPDFPTYATPTMTGLADAATVAKALDWSTLTYMDPSRVTVSVHVDEDTRRPQIELTLDDTDGRLGAGPARVQRFAGDLGLTELETGELYIEWSGKVDDSDVTVVLYLPGPGETLRRRARRYVWQAASRFAHDSALDVLLLASAATGAAAALAARRALR